jgi:hypothetical protein
MMPLGVLIEVSIVNLDVLPLPAALLRRWCSRFRWSRVVSRMIQAGPMCVNLLEEDSGWNRER